MKNVKTIIIVIILILVGILVVVGLNAARTYLSGAAGGTEPNNVRVQADVKSAAISWQTDKESQGVIEYGTTPASLLLRALETSPTTEHKVTLSPLKTNSTYYFRVKVGETIYDNNGIPYSFRTKDASASGEPSGETGSPAEDQPSSPRVTEVPVQVVTPSANQGKVTECVLSEFKAKFGTSNQSYDLDDNGTVNTKDWIRCLEDNG